MTGPLLASAGDVGVVQEDGTIKLWDLGDTRKDRHHAKGIRILSFRWYFRPTGRCIASVFRGSH